MAIRRWRNSEILEALLIGLEQGRAFEWAPTLSEDSISQVEFEGPESEQKPVLVLALENGQEFEIRCKRGPGSAPVNVGTPPASTEEKGGETVKRTVLVRFDLLAAMASVLTGYGKIVGIDHEGTITYELEGEDVFELGRQAGEIQSELRAYDSGAEIVSAATTKQKK